MINDELIEKLKHAASIVSYYNAAEGDSWAREREPRQRAQLDLVTIKLECEEEGIDVNEILKSGRYLL